MMFSLKKLLVIFILLLGFHDTESTDQNIINFRDYDTQYSRHCTNQLLRAMADNNANLVRDIIKDYDLDINARNGMGESLLHLAVWNKLSIEVIKALVELGIDVNAQENSQRTTLHYIWYEAFKSKAEDLKYYFDTSFFLAESGADVHIFDRRNLTCLDLAYKVFKKCFNSIHDQDLPIVLYNRFKQNPKFYSVVFSVMIDQLLFMTSAILVFEDISLYPYSISATGALAMTIAMYITYLLYKAIDNSSPCSKIIYLDNIGKSLTLEDCYSKESVNLIKESLDIYIDGDIDLGQLKLLNNNLNNNLFSKIIDLLEYKGSLNCYTKNNKLNNKKIWDYFIIKNPKLLETYLTKRVKKFLNNIDYILCSLDNKFNVPCEVGLKIVSYLDNNAIKGLNA